ncbi:MAG: hypothetical protein LBR60_04040 [Fibrobacter sp.]|jgi:hypothetical protein|nr:hypothetical protein [Fibrobacter sp.]
MGTIIAEANAIIGYVGDIQENFPDKKDRAYLYDILGGVVKEGEFGEDEGFGHELNEYWLKDGEEAYRVRIAAETFANMASAAITNPKVFKLMKDKLPETHKMFMDILRKMTSE